MKRCDGGGKRVSCQFYGEKPERVISVFVEVFVSCVWVLVKLAQR